MQKIIPYLWFDSEAEEAAELYTSIFKNSRIKDIMRYGKESSEASGQPEGSVLTVEFKLEGMDFGGLNGGPIFKFTPAISLMVGCDSADEVDRLYNALSEKCTVLMPLDKYPFSERYAWINDRFGVSWQLYMGKTKQKITPTLMFVGGNYLKAEEAMKYYTSVFKRSKIDAMMPYEKVAGEKDGAIMHADFSLEGEHFMAMDSGFDHKFNFTPAISFLVNCKDQKEVDHFWEKLSAVPEAEQCGWVQDKYGISWQIAPTILDEMLKDKDPNKARNIMIAMLQMKKIDIKELKLAYDRE